MGPRAGLSATLAIASVTLLVAIAIGNAMGNRVLGLGTERGPAIVATPVPSIAPSEETNAPGVISWKHNQVVSVATDPAFPDPRVTPEPPPPPPTARPTAKPTPTAPSAPSESPSKVPYTSPPLPIPLVTHGGEEASDGSAAPAPGTTASQAP